MDLSKLDTLTEDELKSIIASAKERLLLIEKDSKLKQEDKYFICPDCDSKFTRTNKTQHSRTAKHKRALEYNDMLKRISRSKTLIARSGQY